jgi:glucan endo-1,6-beta-glucosidase
MGRHLFPFLSLFTLTQAWLPSDRSLFNLTASNPSGKIRGVNLGSLFIIEPWMALTTWANMGCGDSRSEFDCVVKLGQTAANSAFQTHWSQWITADDILTMAGYGLNTLRIPVGYWMDESLVDPDSEHFPQGGFKFLEQVCGWASDEGFYMIIDLHGAPGSQRAQKPSPGQVSADTK